LFYRLSDFAVIPTKGSVGSAGYDLSSAKSIIVPAKGKALCPTDLAIACPLGTYGRIAPRSGISWKNHLDVGCGVIDSDYRSNVGVVLFNHSEIDFKIEVGDRIAQLILEKIEENAVLEEVNELDKTQRGAGGFGSTGIKRMKLEDEKLFVWEQNFDHNLFKEILEEVEPHHKEREAILLCIEHKLCYRSYVAKDENGKVLAIAIAILLRTTETLHVEDFALHPSIREKGFARKLWDDWRSFVRSEGITMEAMTIEVYLQNIEPWRKIMGVTMLVTELLPSPMKSLSLAPNVDVMLMGRNLTAPVADVIAEWQRMQRDIGEILSRI